ncbi:MAG: hypothetical protein ACRD6X_00010 [Pyrinomonadaceae bacterium]
MPESSLDKLKKITAWETEPALTEDELEDLLEAAAMPDGNGELPASLDWTPTYDMNKAASDAWLIKAARASALVEVDPPGSGVFTSRVFDNCRTMARIYSARRRATAKITN